MIVGERLHCLVDAESEPATETRRATYASHERASSGLGTIAAYGEQFAGLSLTGVPGTFAADEFVVKPR